MANDTSGPRMAISSALRRQLKTIQNADGAYWFNDDVIYEYPNFNPAGFPAVLIIPSNIASEFDSQVSNSRNYEFVLLLIEQAQNKSLEDSYSTMRQLEDDVIDLIDGDYNLGGLASEIGSNYTLIDTLAVPSSWDRIVISNIELLIAEVRIIVNIQYDIS